MLYAYCTGIRVNDAFQERTCENREHCPYYTNVNIGVALSHPEQYQELDTYNNNQCPYFSQQWQQ
ncbi:MAG: hypothetical protein IJ588_06285 [Prevotella sp.]|nr:hypothetical protein [Prevotella sp.]